MPAPDAPAPPAADVSRLRVQDGRFVRESGAAFQWRGISAFQLLEMLAGGREAEAIAFLDWAAGERLTVVRVLTMAHNLFRLEPDAGRAALPRLLELAASRRLYVEIVALADTALVPVDAAAHVRAIGEIAAAHSNAIVEIANEPVHPTQTPRVHDAAWLKQLAALVPEEVVVALGADDDSEVQASGDFVTVHVSRDTGNGGWAHVLALADAAPLVARWKKPVVSDEPIGAGDEFEAGRRDDDPDRFRAAGLATRMAGLGATFHHEGGLYGRVPDGRELECFRAWNEAWTLLPPDIEYFGAFGTGAPPGIVIGHSAQQVLHRRTEDEAWALLVGPGDGPQVRAAEGWSIAGERRLAGATIVHATRG